MTDPSTVTDEPTESPAQDRPEVVRPDIVGPEAVGPDAVGARDVGEAGEIDTVEARDHEEVEAVTHPAKVMRIGSMVKQLLEEVRASQLDEASRERLAEIYERSVAELSEAMSADLQEELRSLALPFEHDEVPSEAELRVAKAQLVGWLEGLFHGIQASMMAQQVAARAQLQQMRELPGGAAQGFGRPGGDDTQRPGTYL